MSQMQQAVTYTDAQLHARACIRCGTEEGQLERNGYVETETRPGVRLPWAVVACPDCWGRPLC